MALSFVDIYGKRLIPQQLLVPVVVTPLETVVRTKPEVKAVYEVAKAVEIVAKRVC
jgi:hypothetical protein